MKDQGLYKLYVKGADSSVMPYLSKHVEHPFVERCQKTLDDFSSVGLRTLVFGCRFLSAEQFKAIEETYVQAFKSENKKQKMKELAHLIEQDLILLGCTAIKDHLQEKVPESITRFLQARIKMWMITGDKLQTAESIAHSAGIFQPGMEVLTLKGSSKSYFPKAVMSMKKELHKMGSSTKTGILIDISMNSKRP